MKWPSIAVFVSHQSNEMDVPLALLPAIVHRCFHLLAINFHRTAEI